MREHAMAACRKLETVSTNLRTIVICDSVLRPSVRCMHILLPLEYSVGSTNLWRATFSCCLLTSVQVQDSTDFRAGMQPVHRQLRTRYTLSCLETRRTLFRLRQTTIRAHYYVDCDVQYDTVLLVVGRIGRLPDSTPLESLE